MQGALPFKKTPMNVLKRGVEYSPIGLTKGLYDQFFKVSKGKIMASEALDEIASGLSGTAIMALGVFLASKGLISGGKDDDKKQQAIDELQGVQNYALQIGDKSYTIDWAAPAALPLFVGVEIWKSMQNEDGVSTKGIIDSVSRITEPMFNLSMLQGLSGTIKSASYSQTEPLTAISGQIAKSYLGQAVPTVLGQTARTIDDTRRTTYTNKNSELPKFAQEFTQQTQAKIPFASKKLPPRLDQWGREVKNESNVALRAFENFLSPGYIGTNNSTTVDIEIERLYKKTGETGVVPNKPSKYFNVDGKRIDLSAEEYLQFSRLKGISSFKFAGDIIKSPTYKKLDDVDKAKVIANAYEYAGAKAKTKVSKYKLDGWYVKANKAEQKGIPVSEYLLYRSLLPETPKKSEVTEALGKTNLTPIQRTVLADLQYEKSLPPKK